MPGFFSFHKMVSASIVKFTYVVGLGLITLWSLAAIGIGIAAMAQPDEPTLRAFIGWTAPGGRHRARCFSPYLWKSVLAAAM